MAGTIPLSMTQQFDEFGKPLSGGLLYIMQTNTVATPQNPYQDLPLAILMPNPIVLDAAGRVPQFFVADGYIKIRLTDKFGVVQIARDGVLVIGPSSGSASGGGVDPTAILQTGMLALYYGKGIVAGCVRLNGRTIGSAASGASERGFADCQPLFQFLWNGDLNLSVGNPPNDGVPGSGRGVSAAADWSADKQITLPDWRGYAISGLDDMGNVPAGRLTASYFGAAATVLGAAGGDEKTTLTIPQVPIITPAGTIANGAITINQDAQLIIGGNKIPNNSPSGAFNNSGATITATQAPSTFTGGAFGGGQPHRTISPRKLLTIYIKL